MSRPTAETRPDLYARVTDAILVRTANDKHSLKARRKLAGWSEEYLASLLNPSARQPGFVALGLRPAPPI